MKKCASIIILLLAVLRMAAQCPFNDCSASVLSVRSWCDDRPIRDVLINVRRYPASVPAFTLSDVIAPIPEMPGFYKLFPSKTIPFSGNFTVEPIKDDNPLEGISTFDLIKIARHLHGIEALPQPYGIMAAETNGSGGITTADLVELRKLLLGIYKELPNVNAWRFVESGYVFPNPANPFETPFSTGTPVVPDQSATYTFTGIKTGDVNCSNVFSAENLEERRGLALTLPDISLAPGQVFEAPLLLNEAVALLGFQGSLQYDPQELSVEMATPGHLRGLNAESWSHLPKKGILNFVWFDALPQRSAANTPLFTLRLRAQKPLALRDALRLNAETLNPEAYDGAQNTRPLHLTFVEKNVSSGAMTEIFAPQPNPTAAGIEIPVQLHEDVSVLLEVFDLSGKNLYRTRVQPGAGAHRIEAPATVFPHAGVFVWRVQAGDVFKSGKLIRE